MKPHLYAANLLAGLALTLLCSGGGQAMAASSNQPDEALTADEVMACIQTVMKEQTGFIREVEGDDENGKRVCEVKIVDEAGKRHTFHVDVQANQIVKSK
jgi:uncharacterized membrane protein YkoI